jgi:SAM-dependent methyltransferase
MALGRNLEVARMTMNDKELREAVLTTWTPRDENHARDIIGHVGWDCSAEDHLGWLFDACPTCKAAIPKVRVVLEVGCGAGRILKALSKVFPKMIGLDVSPKMLELAKQRLDGIKNVDLRQISGDSYPVSSGGVDLIYSTIVFQHMPSKSVVIGALAEIKRVLRKGGLLRVQTHVGDPPAQGEYRGVVGYFYPSANAFAEEIENIGLKIVSAVQLDSPPWIWVTAKKV